MKASRENIPLKEQQYRRSKGPSILVIVFLCLGLIAAFLAFFVPAFWLQWKFW